MITSKQEANKSINKDWDIVSVIARFGVFIVFGLMILFFALSSEHFFTVNNLLLIIQQASPMGIAVVGMTFVLVVAGIDISVSSNMYITSVVIAMIIKNGIVTDAMLANVYGYFIIYGISIVMGLAIGLINGVLVTKFKILPFIVTISTFSILRGFGYMISESAIQVMSSMSSFSNSKIGPIPLVFIIFLIIVGIFDFILRKTSFGRHLMAIGNSPNAARVAGIKIDRNIIISYMICGCLGAVSGVISAGQIGSVALSFAEGNEFIVISAAVLGGTSLFGGKGTVLPGAIIGILLITTIMNGLAMVNASPYVYTIVRAIIIFLAVMLDSIKYKGELR